MKSKIKVFLLIFTALGFMFSACNKSEDLLTADVKTGGIVVPTGSIAYLLGATPKVDVALTIPMGPGISSVEIYNTYLRHADTIYSNQVLLKTIDVASSNSTAEVAKDYTIVYADLIKGIQVKGKALPTDEALLPIGDNFELSYITVMADGRRIVNNATTNIAIANRWVGSYLMSYYALRAGDDELSGYISNMPWKLATNGPTSVIYWQTHLWGDGKGGIGGIGPWVLTMDISGGPDNPMPVTVTDAANTGVKNTPGYNSRYVPATKTFYISVYWGNGPAHRAAVDTLVYSGPY